MLLLLLLLLLQFLLCCASLRRARDFCNRLKYFSMFTWIPYKTHREIEGILFTCALNKIGGVAAMVSVNT